MFLNRNQVFAPNQPIAEILLQWRQDALCREYSDLGKPNSYIFLPQGEAASCPSCSELLGTIIAEPHIPFGAEHPLAGNTCRICSKTHHHGVNFPSRLQRHAVTVTVCGEATDGSHTFAPENASPVAGSSLADPHSQGLNCYYELTLLCYICAISCTKKPEDILHWENTL